jgi:hypothetical protein
LGCSAPSCKTNNWLRGRSSSLHLQIHTYIQNWIRRHMKIMGGSVENRSCRCETKTFSYPP